MSATADSASQQQQKDETSLSPSKDLPEIKFPFKLKWFFFDPAFRGIMPSTRTYHIPGFPGLKFYATSDLSITDDLICDDSFFDDDDEMDTEDSDNEKEAGDEETAPAKPVVEEVKEAAEIKSTDTEASVKESIPQVPPPAVEELVDDDDADYLRVCLVPTNSKYRNYEVLAEWKERIDFDMEKKNSRELNDFVRFFDKKEFMLFSDECRNPRFFVIKGTFTIKKIYSKDLEIENVPQEHCQLYDAEDGKDFTLVAGKKEIKVHKSVLIHNSPVFAAALNRNEWKEGAERKYAIPDFSHNIVQTAISLIYGNIFVDCLTKEEYVSLFQFADKYQMYDLKKATKESVILTPHNICEYLNLCHAKNCAELLDYCLEYMLIFSENGYPIANKDSLNPEVKILFADRTMEEPQKHRVAPKNNYYSIQNEKEKHEDKDETYFVGWSLCHW